MPTLPARWWRAAYPVGDLTLLFASGDHLPSVLTLEQPAAGERYCWFAAKLLSSIVKASITRKPACTHFRNPSGCSHRPGEIERRKGVKADYCRSSGKDLSSRFGLTFAR